jgi:hypothetical protein
MTETTTDTHRSGRLAQLGEALDRAVRADLAARPLRLRLLRRPRRLAAGVAVVAIVVPAAALAATQLLSTSQVAASLPQGTQALIGTNPTCTVVVPNIEYHCVLASAPSNDVVPGGTVRAGPTGPPNTAVVPFRAVVRTPDGKMMLVAGSSQPALRQKLLMLQKHGYVTEPAPHDRLPVVTTPTSGPSSDANDWQGTVEPTVDATKHVNGGCRALNPAGTEWECYIGEMAVQQNIIGQGFLGQYPPVPGVG